MQTYTQENCETSGLDPTEFNTLLPNDIVLLVIVDKFDPDPVIVNINKLKNYRCAEEGLLDLSNSNH